MLRTLGLFRVAAVAGLLAGAACGKDNGKADGAAGAGTIAGAAGAGGALGAGGVGGSTGGAPITGCPAQPAQVACTGTFSCTYQAFCTCWGCCATHHSCLNGILTQTDAYDGCLLIDIACPDSGADGDGSSTGGGGGRAGGGGAGGGGGAPLTGCPISQPATGADCTGTFSCDYTFTCRCGVCCYSTYRCTSGSIAFQGANDGCLQLTCPSDAGSDAAPAAVCQPGLDGTCNDNPIWAAIYGHCTDAGTCTCHDGGAKSDAGRCLQPVP